MAIALSGLIELALDKSDDMLDRLGKIHVGGVHEGHALRSREELGDCGIVLIPTNHLIAQGSGVDVLASGLQIGGATSEASLLAGGDEQAHVCVGCDDGGDVPALGHDSGTRGEGARQPGGLTMDDLALEAGQLGTDIEVGGHLGDDGGDMRIADGAGDVFTAADNTRRLGIDPHRQRHGLDRARHGLRVFKIDALVLAPPGRCPVHGAGVEIGQTESGGDLLGNGRLA